MSVSTAMFASAGFFTNKHLFYGVSFLARLLQGLSEGWFLVTCPSILAEAYPKQFEVYNGYFMAAQGIGFAVGPGLSAFLFIWLSYIPIFYIFSLIIILMGVPLACCIPSKMSENQEIEEEEEKNKIIVPYSDFFKDSRAGMVIAITAFNALVAVFKDPILSVRLSDIGFKDIGIALIYSLESVVYSIGAVICASIAERYNSMVALFIYCMTMSIGLYVLGGYFMNGDVLKTVTASCIAINAFSEGGLEVTGTPLIIEIM